MKLTPEQRALSLQALPTVDALARRVRRRFPEIAFEDLVSVGREAAVESARSYDPRHEVPFQLFALKHIKGAMLRKATREEFGAAHIVIKRAISAEAEPPPSELSLDDALEDTPEKARARALSWVRRQAAGALLASLSSGLEGHAPNPEELLIQRDAYERGQSHLARALDSLTSDEKHFIDRHYRQGATFEEVATELGVVKRTIIRMHHKVRAKLAEHLRAGGVDAAPPVEGAPG
jgi:RNA polymerase sigma factor (sigma-70 family)